MSDKWMERPPAPCHRTGKDEPKPGQPFFVENVLVAEVVAGPSGPQVRPRIRPLVHASSWIESMCKAPGSPFVLYSKHEAQRIELDRSELDSLRLENEELRAEFAMAHQAAPVDVEALAGALVVPLERHFARRTGPKPKAAA